MGYNRVPISSSGGGGASGPVHWSELIGVPATFPPDAHAHAQADVTGLAAALADKKDLLHGYGQAYGYNYGG